MGKKQKQKKKEKKLLQVYGTTLQLQAIPLEKLKSFSTRGPSLPCHQAADKKLFIKY